MYKIETIQKVLTMMNDKFCELDRKDISEIKMSVSTGNRKIGRVMNVSLPPVLTCANCAKCMHYCYDIKACAQYPHTVIDARMRNFTVFVKSRYEYFRRIEEAISRRKVNKYFRWHVSGDIVDGDYFDMMVRIARRHPDFLFWTYTKNYLAVNEWVDNNGAVPKNLKVMFSEWRGLPMDNPHGFPEFRVVFKGEEKPAGHYCPGNCDICKMTGRGCIAGETTYCMEH